MRYLLNLFRDESSLPDSSSFTDELRNAMLKPYVAFRTWCEQNNVAILAGEALTPAEMTTTLHHGQDADRIVTDGPFLEIKEQLGGFYLIECEHMEQALAAARQVPFLLACEVRPVIDYGV